ncbi:MAG: hypothetical protein E7393_00315 [Ruminococcaceae bacterium]|nr:hypothetical protein [Oscillospiraceae bacterium]
MDIFLEYLMRKKPSGTDVMIKFGLVLAAVVLCVIMLGLPVVFGAFISTYVPLVIVAIIYGLMVLLRNFNLEYEYIFTNGDLDIDIIKGRKTRKRLVSFQCKDIEIMASAETGVYANEFNREGIASVYDAVYDTARGGVYCVLFAKDGKKHTLSFQPPVKLLEAMQKMNPRCVHLTPEDIAEIAELAKEE